MQGGQFFNEDCDDNSVGAPIVPEPAVFLTNTTRPSGTAARNAGYQTLSSISPPMEKSPSGQQPVNFFDNDGPSAFELVGDAGSTKSTNWKRNLSKKGIVSSSFV